MRMDDIINELDRVTNDKSVEEWLKDNGIVAIGDTRDVVQWKDLYFYRHELEEAVEKANDSGICRDCVGCEACLGGLPR